VREEFYSGRETGPGDADELKAWRLTTQIVVITPERKCDENEQKPKNSQPFPIEHELPLASV
jgi:hypothetical protein